jgi:excisionase family DNA binding protein
VNHKVEGHPHPRIRLNERSALSVDEFCQAVGVKRTTAFKLLASGELASFTVGSRRLIPRAALEDFIARRVAAAN